MTNDHVIVITGSSRGIGRGLAEYFVADGHRVAGCSRNPVGFGLDGYSHAQVDLSDEAQVRSWIRSIKNQFGRIDLLISNAGWMPKGSLMTMTPSSVAEAALRNNWLSAYNVCREVAKVMMLQRQGRIVTIASSMAAIHTEGNSAYAASKSALIETTKILAKEMSQTGVTCNVIAPALVKTEAALALGEPVLRRVLETQTIKRDISIAEIANVVKFFASASSASITGQVIYMGVVV